MSASARMPLHINHIEDAKASLIFFSFHFQQNLLYFIHDPKPFPLSLESELLVSVIAFPVSEEIRAPFPGKSREDFLSQALSLTHIHVGSSQCGASFSACLFLSSVCLWNFFPLSPSPMVWVHVWLVFLGTGPSWVSVLFVVCTDCVQRSASDTRWSEFPGIGDPDCIPLSLLEDSTCENTGALPGFVHSEESCRILCRIRNV